MTMSYEEVRSKQREQWNMASHGWITKREEVSRSTRPITEHIVKMSKPVQGHRVLDLGCGVGCMYGNGKVILTDEAIVTTGMKPLI